MWQSTQQMQLQLVSMYEPCVEIFFGKENHYECTSVVGDVVLHKGLDDHKDW